METSTAMVTDGSEPTDTNSAYPVARLTKDLFGRPRAFMLEGQTQRVLSTGFNKGEVEEATIESREILSNAFKERTQSNDEAELANLLSRLNVCRDSVSLRLNDITIQHFRLGDVAIPTADKWTLATEMARCLLFARNRLALKVPERVKIFELMDFVDNPDSSSRKGVTNPHLYSEVGLLLDIGGYYLPGHRSIIVAGAANRKVDGIATLASRSGRMARHELGHMLLDRPKSFLNEPFADMFKYGFSKAGVLYMMRETRDAIGRDMFINIDQTIRFFRDNLSRFGEDDVRVYSRAIAFFFCHMFETSGGEFLMQVVNKLDTDQPPDLSEIIGKESHNNYLSAVNTTLV